MPLQTHFGLLLAALLVSAFLTLGEAAFLGLSRVRRRQLAEEEHPRIAAVERLLANPQRFLIGEMTLNTLTRIVGTIAAVLVAFELAAVYGVAPVPVVAAVAALVGLAFLAFTEIIPKAYGTRYNEAIALRLAPVYRVLLFPIAPVTWLLEKVADRAAVATGIDPEEAGHHFRTEEELKTLITLGTEEGILEEDEEEMIHSVIEFGETRTMEIMVPRADMVAVPGDATLEQVKDFIVDSGYSRVPVYQGSLDNVVGLLFLRDLLLRLNEGKGKLQVKELMRDAFFVPETKHISDLLKEMQAKRTPFAVVIDEYGVTAGIITLEDILEEIVGEIWDEDEPSPEPIRRVDETTAVVDARTNVADVNHELDIEIPEDGPYDTVGGYVFHKLGRLGKEGEVVRHDGFQMTVEKVTNRRILRVRIRWTEPHPPGGRGASEAQAEQGA